jgi:hypothetical protein
VLGAVQVLDIFARFWAGAWFEVKETFHKIPLCVPPGFCLPGEVLAAFTPPEDFFRRL